MAGVHGKFSVIVVALSLGWGSGSYPCSWWPQAGMVCQEFDTLSDSLLYFLCATWPGVCFFLGCLIDFLPLDGLAKWCLAASINFLTFVWKWHSSKFKVS